MSLKEIFGHTLRTWNPDRKSSLSEGIIHATMALQAESGELADKIKKLAWKPGYDCSQEDLMDELGDIGFYWYVLCHELNLDPVEVMRRNKEKLAGGKHGWPEISEVTK